MSACSIPLCLSVCALLAAAMACCLTADAGQPSAALKAGFAERDITPKLGMEQPGGYGKAFHRTFHDPCKVRAAVFDDGNNRVAVVGIDALMIRRGSVLAARKGIRDKCGIPEENILIAASHSHSSGPTGMVQPGEFDHASEFVKTLAYEKSSCADAEYLRLVEQQIVDAVVAADASRQEARCGAGFGLEDKVAFNRRFRMKNGQTWTHPGQNNPEIVEPAGPIDPQVGVLGAWDAKGKLIGCLVNYACHATTSPGGISANYIYYLEQTVRGTFGPEAIVVFLPGCCGDVTQVDNRSPYANPSPEDWARIVGGRVGAEAVKTLLSVPRGPLVPVQARTKTLTLKHRVPRPERVAQCLELVKKDPQQVGSTEWTFAKEIVLLDALLAKKGKDPKAEVEVQAVQVGPVVLLATPGEMFCQLGLDMKAGSPFPFTFPVELANDCVGYVPTEEAFGPHGGGYELRLTSYSNLEPSAGAKMVQACIELAKSLSPGAVPQHPPASPSRGPWSYGNVPPEAD